MKNLQSYHTHGRGNSTYKNIPIQFLAQVQDDLQIQRNHGRLGDCSRIRCVFRGPRIGTGGRRTLKRDAHSFDVYLDYPRRIFQSPMIYRGKLAYRVESARIT